MQPGKSYSLKYRMMVYDGKIQPVDAESYWRDFAHPPKVEVTNKVLQGSRILVYTKNGEGYVHENIPNSIEAIRELGEEYEFTVDASRQAVVDFHHDTSVLRKLTPPPMYVQIHDFEPLGEGSRAEFTMWLGPLPMRWQVVHRDVGPHGFTDIQLQGPLHQWAHQHQFKAVSAERTLVHEHIEYAYKTGLRGLLSRLLFNRWALTGLFTARKIITRYHIGRQPGGESESGNGGAEQVTTGGT